MPVSKGKRSRYTPPPPKKADPSPMWVPVAIATAMLAGLAVVVTNYIGVLPGPEPQNAYLFLGLGEIAGGFILATSYR